MVALGGEGSPQLLDDIGQTAPPQEYVDGLCEEIRIIQVN